MVLIKTDPLNKYPDLTSNQIIQSLGLIPDILGAVDNTSDEEFVDALSQSYGFPLYAMEGEVRDMVYTYPEDPDLFPLAQYTLSNGKVLLQYQYGIIHIVGGNTYRMD